MVEVNELGLCPLCAKDKLRTVCTLPSCKNSVVVKDKTKRQLAEAFASMEETCRILGNKK